jgi:hypothetical protein
MEGTSASSVQTNNLDVKLNEPNGIVKPHQILNGNRSVINDKPFSSNKNMHVMTPGPKKYQNVKKSPDKEPKFVPYEPYKAAVRSIVPELNQPSVAIIKRRLSTSSNCSKTSNLVEDKEDVITVLTQEKLVKE